MSSSTERKTIAVFGATGAQGGSVARALLAHHHEQFAVVAVTRKKGSAKADALAELGATIVEASYDNPESLEAAMTGAYGAWFITSFWDSGEGTVEAEVKLGRNVAEAAARAGVKHLMYSTLEAPAVMGAGFAFPTFDAKVGVEQEILYANVPFTFVQVAYYFNNLENNNANPHAGWYPWKKNESDEWIIEVPIGPNGLHGIHNEDVGVACANMFALSAAGGDKSASSSYLGRKVALSGELLTPESLQNGFQTVFPDQKFVAVNPDIEDYKQHQPEGFGDALYTMYKWYQLRMPRGGDIEMTKKLNPQTHSFADYLAANKARFTWDKK